MVHKRNISVKLFKETWPMACEMSLKGFSNLSSGGHFVQRSGTIFAILVEDHSRNIPVKLFQKPLISLGEDAS